jgi:hypothetical protein
MMFQFNSQMSGIVAPRVLLDEAGHGTPHQEPDSNNEGESDHELHIEAHPKIEIAKPTSTVHIYEEKKSSQSHNEDD